jgi:hypothetical protein
MLQVDLVRTYSKMFEQPVMPVQNEAVFLDVKSAIEAPASAEKFLKQIGSAGLRARSFESVLAHGLLGKTTSAAYHQLEAGDQGQIREFYLHSVEQVAPELRAKFLKVYAYY